MATNIEEIEFILRVRPFEDVLVIVKPNVLRITMLKVWCQRDYRLLFTQVWRLHLNYMIRIDKWVLLLSMFNKPSLIPCSLYWKLIHLLFGTFVEVFWVLILHYVADIIFSVAFLKNRMVDFRLSQLHNSRGGSNWLFQIFVIGTLLPPRSSSLNLRLSTDFHLVLILWLFWRANNTLFPWCTRDFRQWCFNLILTFETIFPCNALRRLALNRFIFIFKVREKVVIVLLYVIKV